MTSDIFSYAVLIAFAAIVVYFIFQRIKEKMREDFEDRDN